MDRIAAESQNFGSDRIPFHVGAKDANTDALREFGKKFSALYFGIAFHDCDCQNLNNEWVIL